ncbi:MAG: DUF5684 domain-containing protein [Flavobacteriaceae bacterium]
MDGFQWLLFFLFIQVIHFLGTWKLYRAAGENPWKAIVPVYNAIVLLKILHRPKWWVLLLFLPVINLMMFMVLWVDIVKHFGKKQSYTWRYSCFIFRFIYLYRQLPKKSKIYCR